MVRCAGLTLDKPSGLGYSGLTLNETEIETMQTTYKGYLIKSNLTQTEFYVFKAEFCMATRFSLADAKAVVDELIQLGLND